MDFNERMDNLALDFLYQSLQLTPTNEEFVGWVDSQPVATKAVLSLKGPAACWEAGLLSFQAWVLTARGFGLADYMVKRLPENDYLRWVERFGAMNLAREQ